MALSLSESRFAPWAVEARAQALRKLLHDGGNQLLGVLSLSDSWRETAPEPDCQQDWEEVYLAAHTLKSQLAYMREMLTEDSTQRVEAIAWVETNQELLMALLPRGMQWHCRTNAESARLPVPESRWRDVMIACVMFHVEDVTGQGNLRCHLERVGNRLNLNWDYQSRRPAIYATIRQRMAALCEDLAVEHELRLDAHGLHSHLSWQLSDVEPPPLREV